MAPILYTMPMSPAGRSVLITAKAIGLQLEEKFLNLFQGEHLTPEFLKLNPQHTIPTLVDDDGFVIWDSNAITPYLVSKYAKNDSLYPKDLKKRAVIDQRLHFNSGVAYATLIKIVVPMHIGTKREVYDSDKESADQVYSFLEAFLDGKKWIAGDTLSVADYHLYTSVNGLAIFEPVNGEKYPKVTAWLKEVGSLPEIEADREGNDAYTVVMKSKLTPK